MTKLTVGAKFLFLKIEALSNKEGYCSPTNKYLAGLMGVSARTIRRLIESLSENGYIKSEIIYKGETKEVAERRIMIIKKVEDILQF